MSTTATKLRNTVNESRGGDNDAGSAATQTTTLASTAEPQPAAAYVMANIGADGEPFSVHAREDMFKILDEFSFLPNSNDGEKKTGTTTTTTRGGKRSSIIGGASVADSSSHVSSTTDTGGGGGAGSRRGTVKARSGSVASIGGHSVRDVSELGSSVDISTVQNNKVQQGREPMTSNYLLYLTLREKILTDPTRRNPMTKEEVAAFNTKGVPATQQEGGKMAEEGEVEKKGEETGISSEEKKEKEKKSNKKKIAHAASQEDPDKTPINFKFWALIDSLMKQMETGLGVGGLSSESNTDPTSKDPAAAAAGAQYRSLDMNLMNQVTGRFFGAALHVLDLDPYLMIDTFFTSRSLEPEFSAEEALEECFHGVRHGVLKMQIGAECKRCTSPQFKVAAIADVPKTSTCPTCGMINENHNAEHVRVRFSMTEELLYIPLTNSFCKLHMGILSKVVGIRWMFPTADKGGAKYQYDQDLAKGEYTLFCPVTDTKVLIRVANDAPEEGGSSLPSSSERLELGIRASWISDGQRRVIDVEHGHLTFKVIQDTPTCAVHIIKSEFHAQSSLEVPVEERKAHTMGTHVLNHPSFIRYFPGQVLAGEQELQMGHSIICFTDLLDSTQQYADLGDGQALRLVKDHFELLFGAIAEENGRVVKTIGDAIMCTFQSVAACVRAITRAMQAMLLYNDSMDCPEHGHMHLKTGIHKGPALMVPLNGINDFFGQTVNIAARVQGKAESDQIVFSKAALDDYEAQEVIDEIVADGVMTKDGVKTVKLKGVKDPMALTSYTVVHPDDQELQRDLMLGFGFQRIAPQEVAAKMPSMMDGVDATSDDAKKADKKETPSVVDARSKDDKKKKEVVEEVKKEGVTEQPKKKEEALPVKTPPTPAPLPAKKAEEKKEAPGESSAGVKKRSSVSSTSSSSAPKTSSATQLPPSAKPSPPAPTAQGKKTAVAIPTPSPATTKATTTTPRGRAPSVKKTTTTTTSAVGVKTTGSGAKSSNASASEKQTPALTVKK